MQQQVVVFNPKMEREHGRKAQQNNIEAAKTVASLISSTLGPNAMMKMILDPMGGTVMTNDGNAILREIDVVQPAAKHMIELARAQDEEVGDGTTSVIVLAGEILSLAQPLLERQIHPLKIVKGFTLALTDALKVVEEVGIKIDLNEPASVKEVVKTCLGTKFGSRELDLMTNLAYDATVRVTRVNSVTNHKDIDFKRYAKVEKIPGGDINDSVVLDGVMFNKDHIHAGMRRHIENPRILLLDTALEFQKGETAVNVEITSDTDYDKLIQQEEEYIRKMCKQVIALKPDVVITEKGVSELAAHFLMKAKITCVRRLRKTDNNRIARATGANVISQLSDASEEDIGKGAGLFEIKKIGDEYFTYITGCPAGSACSIVLRGASKDVLNEMERNLHDALAVTRNIFLEPLAVLGAGALEMEIACRLMENSRSMTGATQVAYQAVAQSLEVIPRILAGNAGANVIRVITDLRTRHTEKGGQQWGIDGVTGEIVNVNDIKVVDPAAVKNQALKTAVEAACMILRVDDVVSGVSVKDDRVQKKAAPAGGEDGGDIGPVQEQ